MKLCVDNILVCALVAFTEQKSQFVGIFARYIFVDLKALFMPQNKVTRLT